MKIFFILVFSANLLAAPVPATSPKYALDLKHTDVEFLALANPGSLKIRGKINPDNKEAVKSNFVITNANLSGKAQVQLAALVTGIDLRDKHMKEKHLQTETFPLSELELTKFVVPAGFSEKTFEASALPFEGLLSLHGKQKNISGKGKIKKVDSNLELELEFIVKMTDFGMEKPAFMGITVSDDVQITAGVAGTIKAH